MPSGKDITETCDSYCSNPKKVEEVKEKLANLDVMVDIFKAMGDKTRFRILYSLWFGELCVCDLALAVNMPIAAVSYHLRYLRSLRLVKDEKRGKNVFYSLDDEHISDLVSIALAHTQEDRSRR